MALKLLYITNQGNIAQIAQASGVDRIFIDLETKGKAERQGHVDSVKSNHSIEDIKELRKVVSCSEILVRINPIDDESDEEIEAVIDSGADIIMLPMFKTVVDVERFIGIVDGRAKTMLLLETREAVDNMKEILSLSGIDEIHIGLNDLHLAYKKKFMFELYIDGTVEKIVRELKKHKYPYGIGGIARIGFGMVPAEYIITELYKLGATGAILSRSFCNVNEMDNINDIKAVFDSGVRQIRDWEAEVRRFSNVDFEESSETLAKKINLVIESLG